MTDGPSLIAEMAGLSRLARTVYATGIALVYETQREAVEVVEIIRALDLSPEEWAKAEAELDGLMFRVCRDEGVHATFVIDGTLISFNSSRLMTSPVVSGRPSSKEWRYLRQTAFLRHGRACLYCGCADGPLVVDHVVPLAKGGTNHPANLAPACKSCNSAKGAKSWTEWWPLATTRRGGAQ